MRKFEVVAGPELEPRLPLPLAELWADLHAEVERMAGETGLKIMLRILEDEVARRVGPPHRPDPAAGCVRWGKQSGYVVFGGQKVSLDRPRVRTREGQEVALESYGQLQQGGRMQQAVRERKRGRSSTSSFTRVNCRSLRKLSRRLP